MKLLKIENNQGYFLLENGEYETIDKLTKEEILKLVNQSLDADEAVEFDSIQDDNLQNQAHQIIYRNVLGKLRELFDRRDEYKDRSERLFLEEYDRYKADIADEKVGDTS